MGTCLCKDSNEETNDNATEQESAAPRRRSGNVPENLVGMKSLSDTVDSLVNETLEVIGTIIDK